MSKTSDTYRMIIDQIKAKISVTLVTGSRSKQFNIDEEEAIRIASVLTLVVDSEAASGYEKITNSFGDDMKNVVAEAAKKTKKK